jgi:hypothetical protein
MTTARASGDCAASNEKCQAATPLVPQSRLTLHRLRDTFKVDCQQSGRQQSIPPLTAYRLQPSVYRILPFTNQEDLP